MTDKAQHTPGPYRLAGNGIAVAGKRGAGEILRATERFMDRTEREANARRAVECLNACEGIADTSSVKELLEALERLLEWAKEAQSEIDPEWSGEFFEDSDFGVAAAAIAKARGEA